VQRYCAAVIGTCALCFVVNVSHKYIINVQPRTLSCLILSILAVFALLKLNVVSNLIFLQFLSFPKLLLMAFCSIHGNLVQLCLVHPYGRFLYCWFLHNIVFINEITNQIKKYIYIYISEDCFCFRRRSVRTS